MSKHDYSRLTPCDLFKIINDQTDENARLALILCRSADLTDKQKMDNITLREAIKRREVRISKAYHHLFRYAKETIRQRRDAFSNARIIRADERRATKAADEKAYADLISKRIRSRAELFLETCRAHLPKEQIAAIWDKAEQENPDHPAFAHISKKCLSES